MPPIDSFFSTIDVQYDDLLKITQIPSPVLTLVELQKKYLQTFEEGDAGSAD